MVGCFVEIFMGSANYFNTLVEGGIFEKILMTSIETRNVRFFTFFFSITFIKSVVSLVTS